MKEPDVDSMPDWEFARYGISLLLNNQVERAEGMFKERPDSTQVKAAYSFLMFMNALMSFEDDKLQLALTELKETERRCAAESLLTPGGAGAGASGWFRSVRERWLGGSGTESSRTDVSGSIVDAQRLRADRLERQIISADCQLCASLLTFLQQDLAGYMRGAWALRRAWRSYRTTYAQILKLYRDTFKDDEMRGSSARGPMSPINPQWVPDTPNTPGGTGWTTVPPTPSFTPQTDENEPPSSSSKSPPYDERDANTSTSVYPLSAVEDRDNKKSKSKKTSKTDSFEASRIDSGGFTPNAEIDAVENRKVSMSFPELSDDSEGNVEGSDKIAGTNASLQNGARVENMPVVMVSFAGPSANDEEPDPVLQEQENTNALKEDGQKDSNDLKQTDQISNSNDSNEDHEQATSSSASEDHSKNVHNQLRGTRSNQSIDGQSFNISKRNESQNKAFNPVGLPVDYKEPIAVAAREKDHEILSGHNDPLSAQQMAHSDKKKDKKKGKPRDPESSASGPDLSQEDGLTEESFGNNGYINQSLDNSMNTDNSTASIRPNSIAFSSNSNCNSSFDSMRQFTRDGRDSLQPSPSAYGLKCLKFHGTDQNRVIEASKNGGDALKHPVEPETLSRLMSAVSFGYGVFQLSVSLLPPNLLRLVHFLGFEGDRGAGLASLMFARQGQDMRAPLATLALLWYHTIVRPFFAVDGINAPAEVTEASALINESRAEFAEAALFLFFKGRVERLKCDLPAAIDAYQSSLEVSAQAEIQLLCLHEIGWCRLMQRDFTRAHGCFDELRRRSRWSRCFYAYLSALCRGSTGREQEARNAKAVILEILAASEHKEAQIEKYIGRRVACFPDPFVTSSDDNGGQITSDALFWRLYLYEMLILWNALSSCRRDEIQAIIRECRNGRNEPMVGLTHLVLGACHAVLDQWPEAELAYREVLQRRTDMLAPGPRWDDHIAAFTKYELAMVLLRESQGREEAKKLLTEAQQYRDYDFENRLNVRVHAALKRINNTA